MNVGEQMSIFDLDIWCGKMSPEPSPVTEEKISVPSSKKRQKWQKGMPAFLDLRSGRQADASWEMGGQLLGEYTMHSFGECPSEERESRLSQILEGGAAPEILFERKGVSGDSDPGREERKETAGDTGLCTSESSRVISFQERAGKPGGGKGILIQDEKTGALSTLNNQAVCFEPRAISRLGGHLYAEVSSTLRAHAGDNQQAVVYGISAYDSNAMKSSNPHSGIYEADTARTLDLNGGNPCCNQGGMAVVCLEGNGSRPSHQGDGWSEDGTMYTLNATERHAVCIENHLKDSRIKICEDNICPTLSAHMGTGGNNTPFIMEPYTSSKASYHQRFSNDGKADALVATDYKDPPTVCDRFYEGTPVVRRLTPLECERLQGYPDYWTNIGDWVDSKGKKRKGESDAPRYKACGNSIAIPFWTWMAEKICATYDRQVKMASLFDGIGGFPLAFSRCGAIPVWASEIEEFPIAVTKIRFPETEE